MSTLGESSTLADDTGQLPAANSDALTDFAISEVARLNSILGASTSDLELALDVLEVDLENPQKNDAFNAIRDALVGCRQLAQFQRMLARLNSLNRATRHESPLAECIEAGVDLAKEWDDLRGVSIVTRIDADAPQLHLDRRRISQAIKWLILAMGNALKHIQGSRGQRIITVVLTDGDRGVRVEVAQSSGVFAQLPYFFESNISAHWWVEGARMLLAWEGQRLEDFELGPYGGFSFEVIPLRELAVVQ